MTEASVGSRYNRDVVIGIAGAAILIAAMAGVFFYERAQFAEYDVSWNQVQAGSSSEDGTLNEGQDRSYTFTADADRLSSITLTLSWTDDVGAGDTFEVVVQGPDGTYTASQEASSSPLEVSIPIREAPETTTTVARSLEDAREQLNETEGWTNGTGDWSATVTLVDAPGEQLAGQETAPDGDQDYELAFLYERWEPTLQPRS